MENGKSRIILAEDDDITADFTRNALQKLDNCVVDIVYSGRELLKKLSPIHDLIMLNIKLPDMNGYEAAKIIRCGSDSTSAKLIYAYTAFTSEECIQDVYQSRMNGFIFKATKITDLEGFIWESFDNNYIKPGLYLTNNGREIIKFNLNPHLHGGHLLNILLIGSGDQNDSPKIKEILENYSCTVTLLDDQEKLFDVISDEYDLILLNLDVLSTIRTLNLIKENTTNINSIPVTILHDRELHKDSIEYYYETGAAKLINTQSHHYNLICKHIMDKIHCRH